MEQREHLLRIQTVCLLLLTAVAIGAALYFLRPVLLPFVLALFLVFCLTPAIDVQVKHLRMPRAIAVVNTILLGCFVLFLLWLLIWSSVSQMTANAGIYEDQWQRLIENAGEKLPLERVGIESDELSGFLTMPRETMRGLLPKIVSSIMSVLSNGLIVVIFMVFMIAGSGGQPPPEGSLRQQIDWRVKRYLLTKVVVSGSTGILVGLTLWLLNVPLAMVFGLLAFLLNFIPSIGSVVATLLPLPVVVLNPDLSLPAKIMAITLPGLIQFAIGNVIEPKVMGESLDLHPVTVLLGLIFFGWLWGIIGMILATPIVAVAKIVLERLDLTAPAARLLSGRLGRPGAADHPPGD
jgi:AI-2 transport protein TqsA